MRILIVDDEEISLQVLKFALESAGHQVDEARDGREALAAMGHAEYHLVISDWEMPAPNGLDLCRAIRGRATGTYVYFILLTSHTGSASLVEGLAAGADDFLSKPFDPDDLIAHVRVAQRILSLHQQKKKVI